MRSMAINRSELSHRGGALPARSERIRHHRNHKPLPEQARSSRRRRYPSAVDPQPLLLQ